MTLSELQALLDRLGIKVSIRGDRLHYQAPAGAMSPEVKAALTAHKPALLAVLAAMDDGPDPTRPPDVEPIRPVGPAEWGPTSDRSWRKVVARWPVEWRERWGRRANELQDRGGAWDVAEWLAFNETAGELADAESRGEITYASPPAGPSDRDAVAAIDRSSGGGDPAPTGPSETGPRDVRRGDKWLPWHYMEIIS